MQFLFNIFCRTEMDTGCPAAQEETTRLFGLFALLATVSGCAYMLLITISGLPC